MLMHLNLVRGESGRMGVAGHGLFAAAAFYYMHNSAEGSSLVRLGPLAPPSM